MAVKTYRATANASDLDGFGGLLEADQTAATRADGWTVAKLAAANMSEFDVATKQTSGTFSTSAKPAALNTGSLANAFRTPLLNGDFAATSWVFTFAVRASVASAQAGRMRMRVYRSANADGSGATEITGSTQVGTTSSALSTTADVTTAVTWSPGSVIALRNEYLFFAIAWEVTTASGSNSSDVLVRTGQSAAGTRCVTPDFVPLTRVTNTRQLNWDLSSRAANTQQLTWDLRAVVANTRQARWDVFVSASNQRALIWDVAAATVITRVSATAALQWQITGVIPVGWVDPTSAQIAKPGQYKVGQVVPALSRVSATRDLRWDVIERVAATRALLWDLRATVAGTRALLWDLREKAVAQRALLWDLRAVVASTRQLRWDLSVRLAATRALLWDIRVLAANTRQLRWDLAGRATSQIALLWDINGALNRVSSTRQLRWDLSERIAGTRALVWDVIQVVHLANTRDLRWDVREVVASQRTLVWDVGGRVFATRALRWDVATPVYRVSGTRQLRWDDFVYASGTRQLRWDLRQMVWGTRTLVFDVRQRVAGTKATAWDIYVARSNTRQLRWDLLTAVARTRTLRWDLSQRRAGTVVLVWDVKIIPLTDIIKPGMYKCGHLLRYSYAHVVGDDELLLTTATRDRL
jgi:hypothetical protein